MFIGVKWGGIKHIAKNPLSPSPNPSHRGRGISSLLQNKLAGKRSRPNLSPWQKRKLFSLLEFYFFNDFR